MYKNLRAEMARLDVSQRELGRRMGWSETKTSRKLTGVSQLTFEEGTKIKRVLGLDLPLDYLFAVSE